MRRIVAHIFLLSFVSLVLAGSGAADGEREVHVARVDGGIDAQAAEYVERVIQTAARENAAAVVIELDTPGGDLDSTRKMVQAESNAKSIPVITYVTPQGARAASAGTFIMMGSDVAAMAPQTRLGAAAPVDAFGRDIPGKMGDKVENDAASFIVGLAEAHGRDEDWAESAVRDAEALGAEEALEMDVVEYVEPNVPAVLRAADGKKVQPKGLTLETAGAAIVQKSPSLVERYGLWVYVLGGLLVLGILMVVGAVIAVRRMRGWRVSTGREGMIGEIGTVRRPVEGRAGGSVYVHGELWKALPEDAKSPAIETDTEVEIVSFQRTAIVVRPLRED